MMVHYFTWLPLAALMLLVVAPAARPADGFALVSSAAGSGSGAGSDEARSKDELRAEEEEAARRLKAEMAAAPNVFASPGVGHRYKLLTTVQLNEAGARPGADVGFQLLSEVSAASVWIDSKQKGVRLLWIEMTQPQLHIKSRKAPAPDGFVAHTSRLEDAKNAPFLALWERGAVSYVWLPKGEELSMANIKKGVASLFQFKAEAWEATEKDASGKCEVTYIRLDSNSVYKRKDNCVTGKNVPRLINPDPLLGADIGSQRTTKFILSADGASLEAVTAFEEHQMAVSARPEAANSVSATQDFVRQGSAKVEPVSASTLEEAIKALEKRFKQTYVKQILVTEREPTCTEDCPSLNKLVKENKDALMDDAIGTLKSAKAFLRLVTAARSAKKDDIIKVLKSSKNKAILPQLYDIVGAAQTADAHEAAMKVLRLDADEDLVAAERYLLALSFGSHPLPSATKQILKFSELPGHSEKMQETLMLTAAALANRLRQHSHHKNHKVIGEVETSLLNALDACDADACRLRVVRALRNLRSGAAAFQLLQLAEGGSGRVAAAALRALRALPPRVWASAKAQQVATRVFMQRVRRQDSSARTLALDLLLEAGPSPHELANLLAVTGRKYNDSAYEVKRYLWQRLSQLSEEDPSLDDTLREALRMDTDRSIVGNWDTHALRGVSTALTRPFLRSAAANGSLSTVQETSGGLLKRGAVDIRLERQGYVNTLFSLGLFAGGLGSFVSSGDEEASEEPATAGMELTVLGVGLRPFVFFNGQGELMGHVWSGTASDRTPAFQVLTLLQDHQQTVPLQSGFIAELSLMGAVSFDLAGQIQLSLWNRNAHSLVEKDVALLLQGLLRVDSAFVRSQVLFNMATEPRLALASDIDFYDKVALCLQLRQPDATLRHNVHKVERIPGSKHRLRKSKYQTFHIPGRTYSLNRQNNEMCSTVFAKK